MSIQMFLVQFQWKLFNTCVYKGLFNETLIERYCCIELFVELYCVNLTAVLCRGNHYHVEQRKDNVMDAF